MINGKTIAVVVPAYNEETQIGMVIESMPDFVDRIVVIDDCSVDKTSEIVEAYITNHRRSEVNLKPASIDVKPNRYNRATLVSSQIAAKENSEFPEITVFNENPEFDRIILLKHRTNSGKGAGVSTGYKWCLDHRIDCTATMDGDGQMDPAELESICRPIIDENIDYVKGNRLIHRSALLVIPKVRYLGNSILSILTKLASGYWHVSDTQTGYAAISLKALQSIRIHQIYRSYGYPNDMLVKLNIAFCTIREVEIKPVYDVGEQSKMKIMKVIPTVSWLLFKSFFKRLWGKYLFRDFHPLFILYHFSFLLLILSAPLAFKILNIWLIEKGQVNPVTLIAFMFLFISSFQSLLFAMWMDMQDNERLQQ